MTYQELVAAFTAKGAPGANGAPPHSPAWNDAYNRYFGTIADTRGAPNFDAIRPEWLDDPVSTQPQVVIPPNLPDDQFLAAIAQSDPGQNQADFARITTLADAGNPTAIQILTNAGYENSSATDDMPLEQGLLDAALPGLLQDIEGDAGRRALAETLAGQATTDYNAARDALSPEENARRLAAEQAQADLTSGSISSSAETAGLEQLRALRDSVTAMQGNLNTELGHKSTILGNVVTALLDNLGTLDATQKAALLEQIAATKRNLETSIAAQKQNLTTEVAALRGAADVNSQARRAALEQELAGLTAAQLPLNQARLDSANALTTGINLGLQSTNDQLTASRAKQGYLGSSSFDQANLARAAIGARQQAAQVMGGAREANAGDMRTIGARGATEGRTLADQYANDLLSISGREATGGRTLADLLAQGTQAIGDTGAAGMATIKNNTGTSLAGINNNRAAQYYEDQTGAASDLRALLDSLAKGEAGITGNVSTQKQTARDQGTLAKQGYFDNAYTRGQGAILSRPGLSTDLSRTLTDLGNYGSTGINRALSTLNWWGGNGQAAPTSGYVPVSANTTGNDIAGLGAGLLGAGLNIGNANSWWQTPKTTAPKTSGGVDSFVPTY